MDIQATVNCITMENLEQILLQFMSLVRNSTYHADGYYVIGLTKKNAVVTMLIIQSVAVQRALTLKRKFKSNSIFHQEHSDLMKDRIKEHYAIKVCQTCITSLLLVKRLQSTVCLRTIQLNEMDK